MLMLRWTVGMRFRRSILSGLFVCGRILRVYVGRSWCLYSQYLYVESVNSGVYGWRLVLIDLFKEAAAVAPCPDFPGDSDCTVE